MGSLGVDQVSGQRPLPGEELEDFFENAQMGLHIVGGDGTVLRANKFELELLGYSAEEYIGRHISEFHADAEVINDILERVGRGELLERCPARLRAKDGSIRHVLITSSALFRDGDFIHTRCFTLDVTETRAAEARFQESEQRFQTMLEALPAAVYTTDAEGKITFYNQAATELAGHRPELGVDEWCVSWRLYNPDGSPLPHDRCPMAIALKEQRPVRGAEIIVERPDGGHARVVPYPTPLFDKNGRLTGAINMLVDITERHAAEQDSARLAAIVLSSQDAIITTTTDGIITYWSAGATKTYGYAPEEVIGQSITRIVPPELHDREVDVLARVCHGERIEHYETERVTKAGDRVSISLTVSLVHDRSGSLVGIAKVGRDITERKRAEHVQNLLIGELHHRVKNTLATIQAIANQTLKRSESPSEFAESFSGRLQALAHAHSVLTENSWQSADLSNLVHDQLLLDRAEGSRISISGPTVALDPQAALHFALIIHELGTNARKHGSLSEPEGRLSIDWKVRSKRDRSLIFHWKEHDGPKVSAPGHRGFGTTLIEQSLQAHGGEVLVDFGVNGVSCEIKFPLRDLADPRAGAYRAFTLESLSSSAPDAPSLRKKRILVVEDEPLVAMELVSTLEDEGCEVVGPAAGYDGAKSLIDEGNFDAALLDANLSGHPVDELAAALTRQNLPFAFITGYGREGLPKAFRQAPLLGKPYTRSQLLATLEQIVNQDDNVIPMERKLS